MGSLDLSSCLFCDESVTKSSEAFDGHVLSHNIKSNQGIFQYVSFLLEEAEKEEIIYNLASKLGSLNSVSQIANEENVVASDVDNSNEEDLTSIQSQLEYDSDSDEDEEEEARRTEAVDKDFDVYDLLGDSDDESNGDTTLSENSVNMVAIKEENVNLKLQNLLTRYVY